MTPGAYFSAVGEALRALERALRDAEASARELADALDEDQPSVFEQEIQIRGGDWRRNRS